MVFISTVHSSAHPLPWALPTRSKPSVLPLTFSRTKLRTLSYARASPFLRTHSRARNPLIPYLGRHGRAPKTLGAVIANLKTVSKSQHGRVLQQKRHRGTLRDCLVSRRSAVRNKLTEATRISSWTTPVSRASSAILRFTARDRCQTDAAPLPFARRWASSMSYNNKTNTAAQALVDRASVVLAPVDRKWAIRSLYRRFSRQFPLSQISSVYCNSPLISAVPAAWGKHGALDAS